MKSDNYDSFLLDYVSGALSPDLAMAADLHCLLDIEAREKASVMSMAKSEIAGKARLSTWQYLPEALELARSNFSTVPWRRGLSGAHFAKRGLNKGQLMRLDPGQRVPEHSHSTIEATVVLDGGFEDGRGRFLRGEIAILEQGERHQPQAVGDTPCICFVATGPKAFWRLS